MTAPRNEHRHSETQRAEGSKLFSANWLTLRIGLIVVFGLILTALFSLWASIPIVKSLASLTTDTHQLETIGETRLQLVELYKLRRAAVEAQINHCLNAKKKSFSTCKVILLGQEIDPKQVINQSQDSSAAQSIQWISETDVRVYDGSSWWSFHFDMKPIQPMAEDIATWLSAHEHLGMIGDDLTKSFIITMVSTSIIGVIVCLVLVVILSQKLRKQYGSLAEYIRDLAGGITKPIPIVLQNKGELSGLAREVHSLSEDLAHAQKRIIEAERMTVWQTVARKVAHEIKNPLTPIGLVGEQLQHLASRITDSNMRQTLLESSRIIGEETASLNRMVREFTAFGRLPEPKLQEMDLTQVIKDFVQRNHNSYDGAAKIQYQELTRSAWSRVDSAMIHQIFHNLLNNARLAKAPEQVLLQISLSETNDFWSIDVTDDGPGIPAEIRDRIFDAYVTTRSTGEKEKGMGLGLTISRQIAVEHGGKLDLHVTGPTGTTIRISLPRCTTTKEVVA